MKKLHYILVLLLVQQVVTGSAAFESMRKSIDQLHIFPPVLIPIITDYMGYMKWEQGATKSIQGSDSCVLDQFKNIHCGSKYIVAGCVGKEAKDTYIFDRDSFDLVMSLKFHPAQVLFSREDKLIILQNELRRKILEFMDWKNVIIPSRCVHKTLFVPDTHLMIEAWETGPSYRYALATKNYQTGKPLHEAFIDGAVQALAINSKGNVVAVATPRKLIFFDVNTLELRDAWEHAIPSKFFEIGVVRSEFCPRGVFLLLTNNSGGGDGGERMYIFDAGTKKLVCTKRSVAAKFWSDDTIVYKRSGSMYACRFLSEPNNTEDTHDELIIQCGPENPILDFTCTPDKEIITIARESICCWRPAPYVTR